MGYEVLEHTADVGIRARGATLEETFEQAAWGMLDILGARSEGEGEAVAIELQADDVEALLVDWLGEVLYLHDARDAVVVGLTVNEVGDGRARGEVVLAPKGDRTLEGTAVKAITYHQLKVEQTGSAWLAEVYVDV